jgi:hypothetical protein
VFKYRVSLWYEPVIAKREITKETDKSVFWDDFTRSGARELKTSQYHKWFDTWEEAHCCAMEYAQARVDSLRRQLEVAKGLLGNVKGMKEE